MIKIPEKEGRLSAAKAAHIEAVIAFVKRKTEGYRRDLFANISRVMLVSGTFEDMSARDDWSWLSDFILADVKTLKQMIATELPNVTVKIGKNLGLCSYYAERGGLLVGYEKF